MSAKARKHLEAVDTNLSIYLQKINIPEFKKRQDFFTELCDTIISQQLSGKAASTIFERFKALFPAKKITVDKLLKLSDEKIRSCGTSWAKVRSLKDLAQKVKDGKVDLKKIDVMSDEDVIDHLVQIKGIGPWSAEMFLMFSLGREDIFSFGDLGLKKGLMKVYNMKKEPTIKQIEKIVSKWRPYRTYASKVLWKSLEIDLMA